MRRFIGLLVFMMICAGVSAADTVFSLRQWAQQTHQYKLDTISGLIQTAKEQKIVLRLPPEYYVQKLDEIVEDASKTNQQNLLDFSMARTWKTAAVIACDWDDGSDRLKLAQDYLGSDVFVLLRKQHPDEYQRLVDACK